MLNRFIELKTKVDSSGLVDTPNKWMWKDGGEIFFDGWY